MLKYLIEFEWISIRVIFFRVTSNHKWASATFDLVRVKRTQVCTATYRGIQTGQMASKTDELSLPPLGLATIAATDAETKTGLCLCQSTGAICKQTRRTLHFRDKQIYTDTRLRIIVNALGGCDSLLSISIQLNKILTDFHNMCEKKKIGRENSFPKFFKYYQSKLQNIDKNLNVIIIYFGLVYFHNLTFNENLRN